MKSVFSTKILKSLELNEKPLPTMNKTELSIEVESAICRSLFLRRSVLPTPGPPLMMSLVLAGSDITIFCSSVQKNLTLSSPERSIFLGKSRLSSLGADTEIGSFLPVASSNILFLKDKWMCWMATKTRLKHHHLGSLFKIILALPSFAVAEQISF